MFKIDKKKEKELRYIANKLRPTFYDANEISYVKGSDLIAKGITEIEGKPVEEKTIYKSIRTRPYPVNHRRRIKEAYIAQGNDGVVEYLKAYNYITQPHHINLGSQL